MDSTTEISFFCVSEKVYKPPNNNLINKNNFSVLPSHCCNRGKYIYVNVWESYSSTTGNTMKCIRNYETGIKHGLHYSV